MSHRPAHTRALSLLALTLAFSPLWLHAEDSKPAEPPKAEAPKAEPPKAEPPKAEPPKAEPPKAEKKLVPRSGPNPAPAPNKEKPKFPPIPLEILEQKPNPVDAAQLQSLTPLIEDARLSTVRLITRNWGKPICMACIVHENGWLISKASEVDKISEIDAQFGTSTQFPTGLRLPVKIVSRHRDYDLALLKMDASGFKPVKWYNSSAPIPGTVLVASGPDNVPLAFGVASVNERNMDIANRGFLGIRLGAENTVENIVPDSPAAQAGIALKDMLLKVNEREIKSADDFQDAMSQFKPSEQVKLELKRDKDTKKVEVKLSRRSDFPDAMKGRGEDPRNAMSGNLSTTRTGFPAALQMDLPLRPEDCGCPVLDLDGNVVGLNIARSGRIDSMAIPGHVLVELLKDVPKGHFYIPEADDLKKRIVNFETEQRKADEEKSRIKQMEEKLTKGLAEAKKRLEAIMGTSPKP